MKRIIQDFKSEHFTTREIIIYGIIVPIVYALLAGVKVVF